MQFFLVIAVLMVAAALAAPVDDAIKPDGDNYDYTTSDGVSRAQSVVVKNAGTENEAVSVRGQVGWTAANGERFTLKFGAEEKKADRP